MVDDQFEIVFAFHCREDYCHKPHVALNKWLCKARSRVATLKYCFPAIELPSDITENSPENIPGTVTFQK